MKVLQERIKLLGIDRSGAYEHYNAQLARGFPIPPYEIAILDMVRRCLPNLRSYHEIGSGLGTLPFMLAHDGFAAVGVERDERRHLTAMTILRELSARVPHIEANCRLFGAAFPEAVADLDVSDSMAILTDFVSSRTPQEYVRLCQGLAQYRYVLMDLQRFCIKREAVQDQENLVEELCRYGLSPCPDFIELGPNGFYRLFESKVPMQRSKTTVNPEPVTQPAAHADGELATVPADELPAQAPAAEALAPLHRVALPPMPQRVKRRRFGGLLGLSALLVIGIPSVLSIAYYGFVASPQYVTTFEFAVRGPTQIGIKENANRFSTSQGGMGAMSPDAFVVTDYINSPQAIRDVEAKVNLPAIFSKPSVDFWSRLAPRVTSEGLDAYWDRMVSAHFDMISGNVSVAVRAFTPQDSLALANALIASSDVMFRRLNVQAQHDFVQLADQNLGHAEHQLSDADKALLAFRDKTGLINPDRTAMAGSDIINDMRKELEQAETQYASLQASSPKSPALPSLKIRIGALERQIRVQDRTPSSHVNIVTPEMLDRYESLNLKWQFAEKEYTEALGLREQAYLSAQNQQSHLALFDAPTLAEKSMYPDRPKGIAVVVLAAAAAWFVGMLITYAVRDHLM